MSGDKPKITIVPMNRGHIDALAQIEKLCFTAPWSANALRDELEQEAAVFYVAVADDTPVGYAGMSVVLDEGYIANIAVHPDCRRQGCATALLTRLCEYARDNGLALLTLEVRRSNSAAIRIYEKAGFQNLGARPGFYENPKEDALIMTKYFHADH